MFYPKRLEATKKSTMTSMPLLLKHIRQVFELAETRAREVSNDTDLVIELERIDEVYVSVAYEAAAMIRALQDFETGTVPSLWELFLSKNNKHEAQIHVGLGWALAQITVDAAALLASLKPEMRNRVLDGWGYHDGTVHKRAYLLAKKIPDRLHTSWQAGYNQGLGRSLWYSAQGNPELLAPLLNGFEAPRQGSLWRGVGIAVSYVGGFQPAVLETLFFQAQPFHKEFLAGLQAALQSRQKAGVPNSSSVTLQNFLSNKV